MSLNLEKQLRFVSIVTWTLPRLTCDSIAHTTRILYLSFPGRRASLIILQVNIGIHVACVPVLLLTAFLFVCRLQPFWEHSSLHSRAQIRRHFLSRKNGLFHIYRPISV